MDLNLFKLNRGYRRHPVMWLKEWLRRIKWMWQRIVRGYSNYDRFNVDKWLFTILPLMLKDLKENGYTYPGNEEFNTPEKWNNYLIQLAHDMEIVNEENYWEKLNEYSKIMFSSRTLGVDSGNRVQYTIPENELNKLYWARQEQIANERKQLIESIYARLAHIHDHLWD